MGLIEQQTDTGMGRNLEPGARETHRRLNSGSTHHASHRHWFHLHGRERIWQQLPVVVLQYRSSCDGISNRGGPLPFATRRSCIVPGPIEKDAIDPLRRLGYEVEPLNVRRGWQNLHALVFFDFPASIGINGTYLRRITAEDESSSIADLSSGGSAQVPDCRSDLIAAGAQKCRQVVCFVLPVSEITACRTAPDLALVDTKNEKVVGADVDDKMFRDLRNLDRFPEMQNDNVALGRAWRSDPLRP